jgi:hypothetical protein
MKYDMPTWERAVLYAVSVAFVSSVLGGCGQRFQVSVNSLVKPGDDYAKSYVLIPSNEGVVGDHLQFQEYAKYLDRALEMAGYLKADSIEVADVAILVSYGIGDPREHTYSYSIPQYGKTGVSSSTTQGTVRMYGNGYGTYSGTTTYQPTYGVTGYTTHVGEYTTYTRVLVLTAADVNAFNRSNEIKEIWRTTAVSTGSSGDLRRVFPIMVAAVQPYLGKNTNKKAVTITLREQDRRVQAIRDYEDQNELSPEG